MRISEFIFYDWTKGLKIPDTSLYHVTDKKVNVGDAITFNEDNIFKMRSPVSEVMRGNKKTILRIVENSMDGWNVAPSEKASRRLGVSPEERVWRRKKPMQARVTHVHESPQMDIVLLKKEEE